MSDSAYCRLEIGGIIPRDLIPELAKQLYKDYWSEVDDDVKIPEGQQAWEQYLLKKEESILSLVDYEASYGMKHEVECWLAGHDIFFVRESGPVSDCDAEYTWHVPGSSTVETVHINSEGQITVRKDDLTRVLDAIRDIKTLEDAGLYLNEDSYRKDLAVYVLKLGHLPSPIDLLQHWLDSRYPGTPECPPITLS